MTLRKLGIPVTDQVENMQRESEQRTETNNLIKRILDYFAFMTDEIDPPTETKITDKIL